MDALSTGGDYNTLKEDPLYLHSLINKYVRVEVIKDIVYTGYLESIDPLQYSSVLSVLHGDIYRKVLIPGHAILNITLQESLPNIKPVRKHVIHNSAENILEKKQRIISWLKKNLLPVAESGDNIIIGNASILPPYSDSDICTDNPLVISQLRNMMLKMPSDQPL